MSSIESYIFILHRMKEVINEAQYISNFFFLSKEFKPWFLTLCIVLWQRLEKLDTRTTAGQAKVAGTIVGIGGAMLLTFYRGPEVNIWSANINILKNSHHQGVTPPEYSNRVGGSILASASCFSISIWLIIQVISKRMVNVATWCVEA